MFPVHLQRVIELAPSPGANGRCLVWRFVSAAVEPFGGPRSTWGGRLADATYAAVRAGIARQRS